MVWDWVEHLVKLCTCTVEPFAGPHAALRPEECMWRAQTHTSPNAAQGWCLVFQLILINLTMGVYPFP